MADGPSQPESGPIQAGRAWVVRIWELMVSMAHMGEKPEVSAPKMNATLRWTQSNTPEVQQAAGRYTPDLEERITGERDLVD